MGQVEVWWVVHRGILQGTFEKALRIIPGIFSLCMNMPTQQITIPGWTTFPLLVGSLTTSKWSSRRPCISGLMIHPSTYEMRFCSTFLTSNFNRPFQNPKYSLCLTHTPSWWSWVWRKVHSLCQHLIPMGRYLVLHQPLGDILFVTRCHSLHNQRCHLW